MEADCCLSMEKYNFMVEISGVVCGLLESMNNMQQRIWNLRYSYSIHMLWVGIHCWLLLCKPGTTHVWSSLVHCTSFLMKLLPLLFKKHWYVYNSLPLSFSHARAHTCIPKAWQVTGMPTQMLLWVTRQVDVCIFTEDSWFFIIHLWFFDCVKLIALSKME